MRGCGSEVEVEVPGGKGDGGALRIGDGGDVFFGGAGSFTRFGRRLGWLGFVAMEENLSLGVLRRGAWLLGCGECSGDEE